MSCDDDDVCVCVYMCVYLRGQGRPSSARCVDSRVPEEQQVITGLNGLNKHDSGRSAVRQHKSHQRQTEQEEEGDADRGGVTEGMKREKKGTDEG